MKNITIIILIFGFSFISSYVSGQALESVNKLDMCSENYNEQSALTADYMENGQCAVDAFITLLMDSEADIHFSNEYQCDEKTDFFKLSGYNILKLSIINKH